MTYLQYIWAREHPEVAKATRKRELKGRRSGEERRTGEAVGSGKEDRNIVDKGDTESNAYTTD